MENQEKGKKERKCGEVKEKSINLKTSRVEKDGIVRMKPRNNTDPNTCRLGRDSPDSPRRLLDCLAAYREQ